MIKLNGNTYLKLDEVENYIDETRVVFRTSHRAILPKKITYLDREFVDFVHGEAKNLSLSMVYLYGYNEIHASVKKIIHAIHDRFKSEDECCEKLYFMQYDLSDLQRNKYRKQYENFLINSFLDECIIKFENL